MIFLDSSPIADLFGVMRLLLTSAGITNPSIQDALIDLLGKPIAESNALCIPTAAYAMPGGAGHAWRLGVVDFFDVSALGSREIPREFLGQRRKMGRQDVGVGVCD